MACYAGQLLAPAAKAFICPSGNNRAYYAFCWQLLVVLLIINQPYAGAGAGALLQTPLLVINYFID